MVNISSLYYFFQKENVYFVNIEILIGHVVEKYGPEACEENNTG